MMTQQRILHFIESEGVYGAERVILNLSQQMSLDENYRPIVGCIVAHPHQESDLYNAALAAGIEALKIPIANKHVFWHLPRAAIQLRQYNIHLIHAHGYKPAVFGFILHLLLGIQVLSTCHLWFEASKAPFKTRALISLEKFFYRWYPKIVGVSDPILAVLKANKIPENKLVLIRNGVDLPKPQPPEELQKLRQELHLAPSDFCIINSARLNRQKDQRTLIAASKILIDRGLPLKVLIVGQGPLESELKEQIATAGLQQSIHMLGFRSDIPALLALADAFVLPSLDEGMPMSLLEAAAASKPIISTLVGDIGKFITHEKTGLAVPIGDPNHLANSLEQLQQQPALAKKLAENAHQLMLEHYSSYAMCQQYIPIYRELLAG